jgi:hypothetical protein
VVKAAQSESMFEDPKWDRVLAEIGRISVYFENLSFNLKLLLIKLEKLRDLSANTNQYNHTFISEVIKKCRNALAKLESGEFGKRPALMELFKDCRRQLDECKQLIDQRNELIHALWFPQAFQPGSVTRLWVPRPKPGEVSEIKTQEHNVSELRVTALEIRNLVYPLHAVTVKLRVAFQQPTA